MESPSLDGADTIASQYHTAAPELIEGLVRHICGPALWETWCCTVSVRPVSSGATFSRETRMYT